MSSEAYVSLDKAALRPILADACKAVARALGYGPWRAALERASGAPLGEMADAVGRVWVDARDARHPLARCLDRLTVACCKADLEEHAFRGRAIPLVSETMMFLNEVTT